MTRKVEVDVVGNAQPFNSAIDQATTKASGFGSKLGNIGKGLAIGVGVGAIGLLTTALDAGIGKLDEMHQAFLEDEASQAQLQNALKNTVSNYDAAIKSAEAFAGAQQKLGFEDDNVRASLSQLVGITHDVVEAQKLSTVALDLARAKNIDLAEATNIVGRAYTGVARGLTNVGIDARGAASGLELVKRIIDNTKGAAEAYAKTGAGRVAAANAKMQDTFEKVGKAIDAISQVVIPIMVDGISELVDITGDVIGVMTDWANTLNSVVGPALAFIGDLARNVAGAIGAVAGAIGAVVGGAQNLAGAVFGGGSGGSGGVSVSPVNGGPTTTHLPGGIFHFHTGGVVPGAPGSDQLAVLQAGERVIPAGSSAPTIVINIASFIGSDRDIDRFSDRLAFRLRSTSLG